MPRDFSAEQLQDFNVSWIHRRDGDTDIYFVSNQTDAPADVDALFRVIGKTAEIWHADTSVTEPAAYKTQGTLTAVPLHLAERESVFVVFRSGSAAPSRTLPPASKRILATVSGPWNITFSTKPRRAS